MGSQAHFDNVEFEQTQESSDLVPLDIDNNAHKDISNQICTSIQQNYACGNRTNLCFVETCLEHISQTNTSLETALYECGILGLQCGHYSAVDKLVADHGRQYKDALWCHFKTTSV
jgi:hypothetical protein